MINDFIFVILSVVSIILIFLLIYQNISLKKEFKKLNLTTEGQKIEDIIGREMSNSRVENDNRFVNLENKIASSINILTQNQGEQISLSSKNNISAINDMMNMVDDRLHKMRNTVDEKMKELQEENNKKLDEIRKTVDEKLHKTLEEKLGESFKMVSYNLEQVHKGLGEMRTLAQGVGDLKKVLSNVKTRGIMGEIQLESILEQILSTDQYAKNIKCNSRSNEVVEFAIKLPGKDDGFVYLPVDAKFPMDPYSKLLEAYDIMDQKCIEIGKKELEIAIKKVAKDINQKYIYPPATTEFAIMFLPMEGLYAEVVRNSDLLSYVQQKYKVIISGPTTFAALLNSLQMGFRTMAIEKRSSEVWEILSRIRYEFATFGDVLEKAQKKIIDAGSEIDKLVGVRSRKIIQQLDKIEDYKEIETEEIDG